MANLLSWADFNEAEDSHVLYRDTSPLDTENLPAPLVTLGANVTSYADGDVTSGVTYYYIVSAVSGDLEVFSDEIQVTAGWSPLELMQGSSQEYWWDLTDSDVVTFGGDPVATDAGFQPKSVSVLACASKGTNVDPLSAVANSNPGSVTRHIWVPETPLSPAYLTTFGASLSTQFNIPDGIIRNISAVTVFAILRWPVTYHGDPINVLSIQSDSSGSFWAAVTYSASTNILSLAGRRVFADSYQSVGGDAFTGTPGNYLIMRGVFDYANARIHGFVNTFKSIDDLEFQGPGVTEDSDSRRAALNVGSLDGSHVNANLTMHELMVFPRKFSAAELANLNSYCLGKYGTAINTEAV